MRGRGKSRGSAKSANIPIQKSTRSCSQPNPTNNLSQSSHPAPNTQPLQSSNTQVTQPPPVTQYPCVTCTQNVSEDFDAIQCDRCNQWLHIKQDCSGLPKKLATEMIKYNDDAIEYICINCRSRPNDGSASIKSLYGCIQQITQTIQGLAASVAGMQTWMGQMNEWRGELNHQTLLSNNGQAPLDRNNLKPLIRSELLELREQDKRKNSVVIRGISFVSEEIFIEQFNQICNKLINKTIVASEIAPINSRFIRFKIENKSDRLELLTSSRNLKGSREFAHIFISKDLTYQQRSELRNRRQQSKNVPSGTPATGANLTPLPTLTHPNSTSRNTPPPLEAPTTIVTSATPLLPSTSSTAASVHATPPAGSNSSSFTAALSFFESPANARTMIDTSPISQQPRNNIGPPNDQGVSPLTQIGD